MTGTVRRGVFHWGPVLALLLALGAVAYLGSLMMPAGVFGGRGESPAGDVSTGSPATDGAPEAPPERLELEVLRRLPHDPEAFTQGLLWWNGSLWESTGQYGASQVRQLDPETGEVLNRRPLPRGFFGEGLARVGERLVQLTWRERTAFLWRLPTLEAEGEARFEGEGWGLCHDGERLILSDGSEFLRFLDPQTLEETGGAASRVRVTLEGKPLFNLNELECVAGEVWANVWTTDRLVRIDPASGRVTATVEAPELLTPQERSRTDVLNGVAHRPDTGTFFLTGKYWPWMFEVRFAATEDRQEPPDVGQSPVSP